MAVATENKVSEQGILFKGPMVRAILAGQKTQTRRLMEPQPEALDTREPAWLTDGTFGVWDGARRYPCRFHWGSRLWVRETWRTGAALDDLSPTEIAAKSLDAGYRKPWLPIKYDADGATEFESTLRDFGGAWGKTRVAIHLPRWASRLTLEITEVRAERLWSITRADVLAEGIEPHQLEKNDKFFHRDDVPGVTFGEVWDRINGKKYPWRKNPWVWVVTFKRLP